MITPPAASQRKGFTLLEIVIYIAIFAVIGVFAVTVLNFALSSQTTIARRTETQTVSQRVLSEIVSYVHQSTGITSASNDTLTLAMASSSINPTVIQFANHAISLKQGIGDATPLTPASLYVSSFSFTSIVNPSPSTASVQIQMTAGYNTNGTPDPANAYSLRTSAAPY